MDDLDTAAWQTWDPGGVPAPGHGGGMFPTAISSSGVLYIGDDNDIMFFLETVGDTFDPTDATSYTFSATSSFAIPKGKVISSLVEYNNTLAIGCGYGSEYDANIYFWDYVSDFFDTKLNVENSWVFNMVYFGGLLYFITSNQTQGTDGIVYATNGSTYKKAFQIPRPSTGTQQIKTAYPFTINKRSFVEWNGKLLIGVSGQYGAGIYCYNPDTGSIDQRFLVASGAEGTPGVDGYYFYAILPEENNITVGVMYDLYAGVSYKIQTLNNTTASVPYRINTNSFFETGLMTVGSKYQPRTFRFFEIQLGKELASGEAITLYYRNNLTDSYTSIGTMSYTNDGAISSKIIENSSVSGDQIQFKCIITCGNTATTGPELKAIYVY